MRGWGGGGAGRVGGKTSGARVELGLPQRGEDAQTRNTAKRTQRPQTARTWTRATVAARSQRARGASGLAPTRWPPPRSPPGRKRRLRLFSRSVRHESGSAGGGASRHHPAWVPHIETLAVNGAKGKPAGGSMGEKGGGQLLFHGVLEIGSYSCHQTQRVKSFTHNPAQSCPKHNLLGSTRKGSSTLLINNVWTCDCVAPLLQRSQCELHWTGSCKKSITTRW